MQLAEQRWYSLPVSFCTIHGTLEPWLLMKSDRSSDVMTDNHGVLSSMLQIRGEYIQWSYGTKIPRKMYRGFHC
jgi:hypothetical protein